MRGRLTPTLHTVLATALSSVLVAGLGVVAVANAGAAAAAPGPARRIDHRSWDARALAAGTFRGTVLREGTVRIGRPLGVRGGEEHARWTSPWVEPGFALTELIPSWRATTPGASRLTVDVRGRGSSGRGSWDTVARWALGDGHHRRSTGGSQPDDLGRVLYDTWLTGGVSAWQVRVTLHRPKDQAASPRLVSIGAVASRLPSTSDVATSRPGAERGRALGTVLPVPRYSQMVHAGTYPQYDGGGEAWCSPTSLTMVLGYYGALPRPAAYSWVRRSSPDRVVPHVARMTYDTAYGGTGTWPFNTAYAASRTGEAFVTRLRSLREAERFVAAGIPLVASVRFGRGELAGSPLSSTNGHLLVVVGFRADGDVVVNDPAAQTRRGVRRTYDRGQFEDVWLRRGSNGSGGSGGLVYVVRDADHPLPTRTLPHNW